MAMPHAMAAGRMLLRIKPLYYLASVTTTLIQCYIFCTISVVPRWGSRSEPPLTCLCQANHQTRAGEQRLLRPALHDGVPSRMRVLTEAPPLPLKTLLEEREIGAPKRPRSSGQT